MRNILVGGEETSELPRCSVGKLLFDGINSKNKKDVALIDAFTRIETTFGEVLESTRQLACGLRKLGLGKCDVVAIINETTVHYTYPVLSCLYLGATINPINPAYSRNEFLHAFTITRPRFIICCEAVLQIVLSLRNEVPSVDQVIVIGTGVAGETIDLNEVLAQGADTNNDLFQPLDAPDIDLEQDVAAILCSSGTTGLPKGVMLTHMNIRSPMTYLYDDKIRCIGSDGNMQIGVAPGFHILGLWICLAHLLYNSKLIMMVKFKPDMYLKAIEDYKVNTLIIVPSLAVFLAKSPLVLKYDVSSVKDILCGAAALGKDVQQLLDERFHVHVRQCYGMTEAGGAITFCVRPKHGTAAPQSVGIVVPGISVKFADLDTNESLPAYRPGEIRAKGCMIMKGYAGDADATNAMFDDEGFLRTGDIGYYDDDGYVFIVDRLKDLIKYKGYQVPPAELEDILLSHPEVKDAGVIGIPDERAGELPLAFVVKQPGATVDELGIINYVKAFVQNFRALAISFTTLHPTFMNDSHSLQHSFYLHMSKPRLLSIQKQLHGGVRFVDEIPKNASGKILRRKLKEIHHNV